MTATHARPFRLLRSMLFVPASAERFFEKAAAGEADGVILDLEDAVAPDLKARARANAVAALNDLDWRSKTMSVRVNGVASQHHHQDIIALAGGCPRLDLILLPMVNTADDVRFTATLLAQVEAAHGRAQPLGIEGIIETALGFENISAIATSSPRLEALSFGAGDYAADMKMRNRVIGAADPEYAVVAEHELPGGAAGATHVSDKWHFAMARLANACHAHDLRPRDSAYADFKNPGGFRAAALRARALGFAGKSAIHPSQIGICNEVFGPSEQEVDWARRLIAAMQASHDAGQGAVALDGEMVDAANIKLAGNILAAAEAVAKSSA